MNELVSSCSFPVEKHPGPREKVKGPSWSPPGRMICTAHNWWSELFPPLPYESLTASLSGWACSRRNGRPACTLYNRQGFNERGVHPAATDREILPGPFSVDTPINLLGNLFLSEKILFHWGGVLFTVLDPWIIVHGLPSGSWPGLREPGRSSKIAAVPCPAGSLVPSIGIPWKAPPSSKTDEEIVT